jgi:hypothetical protein
MIGGVGLSPQYIFGKRDKIQIIAKDSDKIQILLRRNFGQVKFRVRLGSESHLFLVNVKPSD